MFTLKSISKNNSNKKSTQKGAATINKPELAADLGIDTSIDVSNKDFVLSRAINRKLESGRLDRQIDINETQQLGDLFDRGEQQSMFEDPLTSGSGTIGRLQSRDRIAGARDIEGLAGQHSAENYLGGAGSVDRYDSPGEKSPEWEKVGISVPATRSDGVIGRVNKYVNKNDPNHKKTVADVTTNGKTEFVQTLETDTDTTGTGDDQVTVTEKSETIESTSDNGTRRTNTKTETRIEIKEGTVVSTTEVIKIGDRVISSKSNREFTVKEKAGEIRLLKDPNNDNNARPMTDKDDPMGIIGDRDSMHKRLRVINPEIDPMNEGDQTGYGNYINPALRILGNSNVGRSTGAWEEVGGAYVGPNIGAINDSLGGTSTGNDWF